MPGAALCSICVCRTELGELCTREIVGRLMVRHGRNNSGSLAIFTAIRPAPSFMSQVMTLLVARAMLALASAMRLLVALLAAASAMTLPVVCWRH